VLILECGGVVVWKVKRGGEGYLGDEMEESMKTFLKTKRKRVGRGVGRRLIAWKRTLEMNQEALELVLRCASQLKVCRNAG